MKKALLLLTAIVTITACQSSQNQNANLNSNAAGNQNANQVSGDKDVDKCESNSDQQYVREVIIDSLGHIQGSIDPIYIKINKEKAVWCIKNKSAKDIRVLIGNLHVEQNPVDTNPFGDGTWRDNIFSSKKISAGELKHLKTKPAFKGIGLTYKYDFLVIEEDGGPLDFVDPQVVISDNK